MKQCHLVGPYTKHEKRLNRRHKLKLSMKCGLPQARSSGICVKTGDPLCLSTPSAVLRTPKPIPRINEAENLLSVSKVNGKPFVPEKYLAQLLRKNTEGPLDHPTKSIVDFRGIKSFDIAAQLWGFRPTSGQSASQPVSPTTLTQPTSSEHAGLVCPRVTLRILAAR